MTNLKKLKYSLTKFGAYKLAYLLEDYPANEILSRIDGNKDFSINDSQVKKVLSVDESNNPPSIWDSVKQYGTEEIYDLVFLGLILSHHELIRLVSKCYEDGNIIHRRQQDDKPYTNLRRASEDLGFGFEGSKESFKLDLSRIFYKDYLRGILRELFALKLKDAGWDGNSSLMDEARNTGIYKVFGLSFDDFSSWITGEVDQEFIEKKVKRPEKNYDGGINFVEGHKPKYEGTIEKEFNKHQTATFEHNKIQTRVYNILKEEYPEDKFGTEVSTNIGSVDLVKKASNGYVFYEIKTASNTRTSVRQAMGQLLEYAYWNDIDNILKIVIIAPTPVTEAAISYLTKLRTQFNLPVYYQYYDGAMNRLEEEV